MNSMIKCFSSFLCLLMIGCGTQSRSFDGDCSGIENACTQLGFEECSPHDARSSRVCQRNANGCLEWREYGLCVGPDLFCGEAGHGEVDCRYDTSPAECSGMLGAEQCMENALGVCGLDHDHRLTWEEIRDCSEFGEICVEFTDEDGFPYARCLPEICESVEEPCTEEGFERCSSQSARSYQVCELNSDGCLEWREDSLCVGSAVRCTEIAPGDVACEDIPSECSGPLGVEQCMDDVLGVCGYGEGDSVVWYEEEDCNEFGQVCSEYTNEDGQMSAACVPEHCSSVPNPCGEEGWEECLVGADFRTCVQNSEGCLYWQVQSCVGTDVICFQERPGETTCQ